MTATRVLISNGLESYRQALAEALRELRPAVEVFEAEPGDLDRKLFRVKPLLVICGYATSVVKQSAPNWVELYVNSGSFSIVSLEGRLSVVEGMDFPRLLEILDQVVDQVEKQPGQSGDETHTG